MKHTSWVAVLCILCTMVFFSTESWSLLVPVVAYGEATEVRPISSDQSLLFVGDVMLARQVAVLSSQFGAFYPWSGFDISSFASTTVVANFEASVPAVYRPTPAGSLTFAVPHTLLPALATAGVDLVSLANNHSDDYGMSGFIETTAALQAVGITSFGSPSNDITDSWQIVTLGDHKVAIVGLYLLEQTPTTEALTALFDRLNTVSDFQIAYVHWGNEYELTHSPVQEAQAKRLIAAGFDCIIGHHPHVVQDIGVIDEVPVVYSLGNYIFDQYFSFEVMNGLAVKFSFSPEQFSLQLYPVESRSQLSQPHAMDDNEKNTFLHSLAQKSDTKRMSDISNGTLTFPLQTP